VHEGPVAGFTHIWAGTYHGTRWLLLGRELSRLPGTMRSLGRVLAHGSFAIVHLNDSPPIAAAWLAHRRGIPIVWHLRSAAPDDGGAMRTRLLRRLIERLAAAVLAINTDVAESWALAATVVANPVDLERFSPGDAGVARAKLGLPADRHVVSFVGFVYPAKGARELIQAAARLGHATVLIAGGGVRSSRFFRTPAGRISRRLGLTHDHEADARALVAALGLERSVRFLGYVTEIATVYRASDVVVAPSQGPEIARSLLEAASCGVAAVGTGSVTGGGVLEPGTTTTFAAGESAPLAAAISALLDDPERRERMGAAARAHAVATFAPARIAALVEGIYAGLLERSKPSSIDS
jgi:glycosyltransferase involved in cell wall biosynthesis